MTAREREASPRPAGTPGAWTLAALMRRVFDHPLDVLAGPRCGGRLRLIATLHDPAVIRKILAHVGIAPLRADLRPCPTRAPRRHALIGSAQGAADAVVPAPRGAIGADPAGPPAD